MASGDAFFKGYDPVEVRSGRLYKYIILPDADLNLTRKNFKTAAQKFPGSFIVRKEGETLTRIP